MATPLCVVLVAIETTDLIFAVDSIPAVLAVTRDPFVVFTSNVFAILGLRAMYFALAGNSEAFSIPALRPLGHPRLHRSQDASFRHPVLHRNCAVAGRCLYAPGRFGLGLASYSQRVAVVAAPR